MTGLGRAGVRAWAALAVAYLFAPIVVVVAFGFNDPAGKFNFVWRGFSLDAWRHPLGAPGLGSAVGLSLRVAVVSTVLATALGTLLALGLVRMRARGRGALDMLVLLPLTMPDVVLGASLLSLLLRLQVATGFWTIVAAHVMFGVAYVTVTVRARLQGFEWELVEAAMDLGAREWRTLRRVTIPLLLPGILAGGLLAFALSLDDFTITLFVSGQDVTYPLYVWGASRFTVPPQVNVLATMILVATLVVAGIVALSRREPTRSTPSGPRGT